jgi:hypothetical protein
MLAWENNEYIVKINVNQDAGKYAGMKKNSFGWSIDDRFTSDQYVEIQAAGWDLTSYIDSLTSGRGRDWIRINTSATRIHRGRLPATLAARVTRMPTSLVFPLIDIWLAENFDAFPSPKRHFLHELGHVVDNRIPKMGLIPHTIIGGGVADRLIEFLGGRPAGWRFCNGSAGLPARYHWQGLGSYGNHSTADYFAEAFSWLPYDLSKLPDRLVARWFKAEVFLIA